MRIFHILSAWFHFAIVVGAVVIVLWLRERWGSSTGEGFVDVAISYSIWPGGDCLAVMKFVATILVSDVVACACVAQWPCLSMQHQLKFCSCPGLTDNVRVLQCFKCMLLLLHHA